MSSSPRRLLRVLGPGMLFAAAAVGVSHLVQSTRAGAVYGLAMLVPILLANALKYPAFRFGPEYAAATRTSLLEGYRRQGRWALGVYAVLTLGTMFTIEAAVTVVTAGLVIAGLGLDPGHGTVVGVSAGLIGVCAALLAIGHYRWLDRVTRVLVGALTACTLAATAMVLPNVSFAPTEWVLSPSSLTRADWMFMAALAGWMPSAIDIAVWQSLWTLARGRDDGRPVSPQDSQVDFHAGYIGTALLALCFMLLGAGVMHGAGVEPAAGAGAFAAQIIGLYTETLGAWAGPIISVAAFAVMFSTTLTVVDGFPRAIAILLARLRTAEDPDVDEQSAPAQVRAYWIALALLAAGSVAVLAWFMTSLRQMVDVATTLSFLTAPVLALLNHRAMTSDAVPEALRPGPALRAFSAFCIAALAAMAVGYVVLVSGG